MFFNDSRSSLSSSLLALESSALSGVRMPTIVIKIDRKKKTVMVNILFNLEGEAAQKRKTNMITLFAFLCFQIYS
jgi:hypothetical protein